MNLYETLELRKDCSNEELFTAYRRLSVKYHPKMNYEKDTDINTYNFHKIAESFIILSNAKLRGIYDIYGYNGVKWGIKNSQNEFIGGYKYDGSGLQLFEKIFATVNPFALNREGFSMIDEYASIYSSGIEGSDQGKITYEDSVKPLELKFSVSLEQINKGGNLPFSYTKKALHEDKRTLYDLDTTIEVYIYPGIEENTKLRYSKKGNEYPGKEPSDLILTIVSKPHDKYIRKNADLFYKKRIYLYEALNPTPFVIYSIEGKRIDIFIDEIITPTSIKKFSNFGLSQSSPKGEAKTKGDLYVTFDIIFPIQLSLEAQNRLQKILK